MTYGQRSVRTGAARETVAVLGAGGRMGFAMARNITRAGIAEGDGGAWERGLDLPLFELIAYRLVEGTGEHGDKDVSATYLTGAPEQAA